MKIGKLEIDLLTELARIRSDMQEAKGIIGNAMGEVERSVASAKNMIFGLTGSLVGIGSVAAFKSMVGDVIDARVELARLSMQTGASVESLSAIGAVAKMTGTSIADVGSAINKMQKNLATSNEDGKGAAQAIKALGIDFDTFKGMKPDEQMLTVAKAMDRFQDGGGKAAAAMLLWGKSGAQMLPMMAELAEKNDLVGKTTTEAAEQALQYEKNIKNLKVASDAWKRQLVDEMMPALTQVTNAMLEARKTSGALGSLWAGTKAFIFGDEEYQRAVKFKEAVQEMVNLKSQRDQFIANGGAADGGYVRGLNIQIELSQKNVATLQAEQMELQKLKDSKKQAADDRKAEREANGQVNVVVPDYKAAAAELKLYTSAKQALEMMSAKATNATQLEKTQYEVTSGTLAKLTDEHKKSLLVYAAVVDQQLKAQRVAAYQNQQAEEFLKLDEAIIASKEDLVRSTRLSIDATSFEVSLIGKSAIETQKLTAVRNIDLDVQNKILALQKQAENNPAKQKVVEAEIADILRISEARKKSVADSLVQADMIKTSWGTGAATAFARYGDEVRNAAAQSERLFTSAFKNMEDAVVNFVKTGTADFSNFADQVISDLIRIQVQQSITGPLAAGMRSWFGGGGGWGTNGGSVNGTNDLSYANFAQGGTFTNSIVDSPTMFKFASGTGLMGEAGPEAIMPLKRGADGSLGVRAAGAGNGSNVTVNVVESPGNGGQTSRSQQGGMDVITIMVEKVKSSLASDISRGSGVVPAAMTSTYGLNRVAGAY